MTKKKVTLAGRKRTKDLQNNSLIGADNTTVQLKKDELQTLQSLDKKANNVSATPKQTPQYSPLRSIVDDLSSKYQKWSLPFNHSRYCYSPNDKSKMLLMELKKNLNELGKNLLDNGYHEDECKEYCQQLLTDITEGLRCAGIPVGAFHLMVKK